nr:ribonuclease H-like domain-containing protein [Tanacetum cinerariifolium]
MVIRFRVGINRPPERLNLYVSSISPLSKSYNDAFNDPNWSFFMTDLDSLNYFLGISVTRNSLGMFLSQRKYAAEILERAHMSNCNLSRAPVDTESKLRDDGDPVSNPIYIGV